MRPTAATISPILGNMVIKVSIIAGVTATAEFVTGTIKLCVICVIKILINGAATHTIMQIRPILLNMVSDFQNVLLLSGISEQIFCSCLIPFILIISKTRYISITPQNNPYISCLFDLKKAKLNKMPEAKMADITIFLSVSRLLTICDLQIRTHNDIINIKTRIMINLYVI